MGETIETETGGGACVIRLNRPDSRNAISVRMMEELVEAVAGAEADRAAAAVIVTGGERFFSAGRDLKEVAANTDPSSVQHVRQAWRNVTDCLESCGKPVIAAIEGHCLTGGLELALACDLRVAGAGARFAITSARLGTLPQFGATQRLPRLIGAARAMELLFLADPIDADQALRIGLVNRRTAEGDALTAALGMAATLRERAPLSLAALKRAVRDGLTMPLADALDLELALGGPLATSRDRAEGLAAFAEKRKPNFTGE